MPLRKYWIVLLLLGLGCQVPWASAQILPEHEEALAYKFGSSLLSEDLEQQLRSFFTHDLLVPKLLDWAFMRSQPTRYPPVMPTPFVAYEGKRIGRVQLHKQGVCSTEGAWWERLLNRIIPLTKDWVIWDQLHFAVGDRLVAQRLLQREQSLNKLPFIEKAHINVQESTAPDDTVDLQVTTQDRLPITGRLNFIGASVGYNNLLGWGHTLQGQLLYKQGLGYAATYRASDLGRSGIASVLQYCYTPKQEIRRFRAFRKFDEQASYAGAVAVSYIRQKKERLLAGHTHPGPIVCSLYYWDGWVGRTFSRDEEDSQGQLVVTGGVSQQHFIQRPAVAPNTNRSFHHAVFGAGSVGFTHKKYYEDQRVYGVGDTEYIAYGGKINLTGGYQIGEFVNRPYLRLDLAQGGQWPYLGHWYGVVNVGGFWQAKAVEQGICKLHLHYFTPLLGMGSHWIRQFIHLRYLVGLNMFTGEFISTNTNEVSPGFRDPFLGGTQRLQLCLETVVFTPMRLAGCQVAALGFVEACRLQDAQGRVRQCSFCKTLGVGFRCAHPRWRLGALQVQVGYQPLVQGIGFELGSVMAGPLDGLDIDAPGTIPFQEY